ncbi:hypothetical protein SUGI_0933880 [Cryptomeria japonica]|nr:hypothetical protein SUGI_0933880 [Cryptomeria japonica]
MSYQLTSCIAQIHVKDGPKFSLIILPHPFGVPIAYEDLWFLKSTVCLLSLWITGFNAFLNDQQEKKGIKAQDKKGSEAVILRLLSLDLGGEGSALSDP